MIENIKKYKVVLIITLIALSGIFFFFYHFGNHDADALTDFSAAYEKYDQAILDYSLSVRDSNPDVSPSTSDLEQKAEEALAELKSKSSARISSLTRNDAELMNIMPEIAYLSEKEFDTLKAYQGAVANKNADLDVIAKELSDLKNTRQAAYARFLGLEGPGD